MESYNLEDIENEILAEIRLLQQQPQPGKDNGITKESNIMDDEADMVSKIVADLDVAVRDKHDDEYNNNNNPMKQQQSTFKEDSVSQRIDDGIMSDVLATLSGFNKDFVEGRDSRYPSKYGENSNPKKLDGSIFKRYHDTSMRGFIKDLEEGSDDRYPVRSAVTMDGFNMDLEEGSDDRYPTRSDESSNMLEKLSENLLKVYYDEMIQQQQHPSDGGVDVKIKGGLEFKKTNNKKALDNDFW